MTKTTWNLTPFFRSDTDPAISTHRAQIKTAANRFARQWQTNDSYLTDPAVLANALKQLNDFYTKYGTNEREVTYFSLREAQNETDPKIKAKLSQAVAFAQEIHNQLSFFTIRLSKIDAQRQKQFTSEPKLKPYHRFLERLFAAGKHTLTEAEEKILVLKSQPSHSNWLRLTSSLMATESVQTVDEQGKKTTANFAELMTLLSSQKPAVRNAAARHVHAITAKYAPIAENELNSILQNHQIDDRLQGFARPDSSRLLSDDINEKTIDAMLTAVAKHYSIANRYYQLKSKLLGKTKLSYHERNVTLGKTKSSFTYDEACKIVLQAFEALDPQFASITESFIKEGRVDALPAKGKSDGAFCTHGSHSFPAYIMLNHTNRLQDVLTLAHELGHGINHTLILEHQPALYSHGSLATAEVASTFMEDFVLEAVSSTLPAKEQLSIKMTKLNDDISTIFRQVACYKFEQDLHQQFRASGYLDHQTIGKLFQKHMAAYMGKHVTQDPGSENWWVYWSHIRNFFYVYSYASGLLISKALQRKVRANPGFIHHIKYFLSAGSSQSPTDIFKHLGLDITKPSFWEQGIAEIEQDLAEAEKLAKKQ